MVRPCNHAPHPLLQLSYYIYSLCHLVFKTPLYITLYKSSRPITNPSKTVLFTPSVLHNREPKKGTVKLHRIDGNEDTLHSQTKEPRKQVLPPHQSIIYLIMPSGMAGGAPITAPPPATPRLCRSMLASQPSRTNTYTRTTTFSRPYGYERARAHTHTHVIERNLHCMRLPIPRSKPRFLSSRYSWHRARCSQQQCTRMSGHSPSSRSYSALSLDR